MANINNLVNGFLLAQTIFLVILIFTTFKFFKFKRKHQGIGKTKKIFKRNKNNLENVFSQEEKQKYLKMKIFLWAILILWIVLFITTLVLQATIGGGFNVQK